MALPAPQLTACHLGDGAANARLLPHLRLTWNSPGSLYQQSDSLQSSASRTRSQARSLAPSRKFISSVHEIENSGNSERRNNGESVSGRGALCQRARKGGDSRRGRRVIRCSAEGNGAVYSNLAVVEALRQTLTPRKFVSHIEGGGQVRATVSSSGQEFLVQLDASLDSSKYDSARPLLLHWGIHRSDSASWYLLEADDAPPGTNFVQSGETEAMRSPFEYVKSSNAVNSAVSLQQRLETVTGTLALQFSSALAPFSLDFVLYQPPGDGRPEQYLGSPRGGNFSVPVGMERGCPEPLGATRLSDGSVNFAVYSKHAHGVVLCLYEALASQPSVELDLEAASHKTGDVWHVRLFDTGSYAKYGYRCKGDVAWDGGHRFHSRAVLLDPYAKILAAPVPGQDALPSPAAALGAIPALNPPAFDWQEDYPLRIPEEELSVYRLNVGAFTIEAASGVPSPECGTFLGVARKASYLRSLGINSVLLQPVAAFDEGQGSYFPFSFFAPMPAYGVGGDPALASRDLKYMVRELHKWGIEVMIEVVVSHTAEQGDEDAKTISFRGIDNKTYYLTDVDGNQMIPSYGAPNAFNCNHPVPHTLIVDALNHWVTEYHIDGFSFVNVQALLTGPHGQPVARPLLVEALSFEPLLASVKLIADPCSPSTGACEVVQLPHWWRWMELNSRFRTDVRRFLRGSPGQLSTMATRIAGSGDLFSSGRGPSFSLNYVTAFAGLTLADLVSYTVDPEDSWSCGVDGPSQDPFISATRLRQVRNFICALYLSLGVPVFVMGDEYGSSKEGGLALLDWDGVFLWPSVESELAQQLSRFVSTLAGIRRRHRSLERRDYWFAGDIAWHGVHANEQPAWDNPGSSFLAYSVRLLGESADVSGEVPVPGAVESCLYVAFNAQQQSVQLYLPEPPPQTRWFRIIDTSQEHPNEISAVPLHLSTYDLAHFSVLALEARQVDAFELSVGA